MKKFMVLFAVLLLFSCQVDNFTQEKGELKLVISEKYVSNRTLVPDVTMEVAAYTIKGAGPMGLEFESTGITESVFLQSNLAAGTWTIVVEAVNPDGIIIARDVEIVEVVANRLTTVEMVTTPIDGIGALNIQVTWPEGEEVRPTLEAVLTPEAGEPFALDVLATGSSATINKELKAGYYMLTLKLVDGPFVLWGTMEAVRILADEKTTGVFEVENLNITAYGAIEVIVSSDLQNPLDIKFSGGRSTLEFKTSMTVTAVCSDIPDSYQWFLNGSEIPGETKNYITIGSTLPLGYYNLNLLVKKGNIFSSEGFPFSIKEDISGDVLFFEDFEDQDLVGWTLPSSGYTYAITSDDPGQGLYSLNQNGTSAHHQGITHPLPEIKPEYIGYYVKVDSLAPTNMEGTGYMVIGDQNTASNHGIIFCFFSEGGVIRVYDGLTAHESKPIEANRWYHVEFINIDWNTKTFDFYVDGELVSSNIRFRSQLTTSLTRINLYNFNLNSNAWYDDILIK